jgi:hypothetical protein
VDKALLFKLRLTEQDILIDGVGTVRVRALSRDEMAQLREDYSNDEGELEDRVGFEHALIALAMVDPVLTSDEVELWSKASPGGELIKVLKGVNSLSGLDDMEGSKSVSENRQERRAALRARTRHGAGKDAR